MTSNAHQHRISRRIERERRASSGVGVDNKVIEVEVTKAEGMRPAASRVIDSGYVAIGVVFVGKRRQINPAKARHTKVKVVIEAIEGVKLV